MGLLGLGVRILQDNAEMELQLEGHLPSLFSVDIPSSILPVFLLLSWE